VTEPKLNVIEAQCVARGMRMTEQRRGIAQVLARSADHPDAGIIERHDFREGRARYEQMSETHHDHLIDLRSGKVIEFRSEEIERLQADIARRLSYRLVDHRLELYAVPPAGAKKR